MARGAHESENYSRKQICKYLQTHPGISFLTLLNFFEMNKSTLTYHLNYLEDRKTIRSEKKGKMRVYFFTDWPVQTLSPMSEIKIGSLPKTQRIVLKAIKDNPGITQKELAKLTDNNQTTISYTLARLLKMGVIWKVKTGGKIGYEFITRAKLKDEMLNRLLLKLLKNEVDKETFKKVKQRLEEMDIEE